MRPIVSLAVLATVLTAPSLHAQTIVCGESRAATCYHNAAANRADLESLRDCNAALTDSQLTRRDRAATLSNRGIIHLRRNDAGAALADFDAAEQGGLADPGALGLNRSSAYIYLDRPRDALVHADLAIAARNRHSAPGWYNRGVALEALGDLPGAYQAYREALALRPDWHLPARELERFSVDPSS